MAKKSKIDAEISLKTNGTGKVVADVKKVNKIADKAERAIDGFKKKLSSANKGMENFSKKMNQFSLATMGAFAGTGLAVKSFIDFSKGVADRLDSVSKFSRNVGMSVPQLQKWQYAAERSGVNAEQFNSSMSKFSVNVAKALGGEKKQVELFNAMGIKLRKQNGEAKTNNQLMMEVANAYGKIKNAQDKIRVAEFLFGNTNFLNLFEGGTKGIEELMARREKLGNLFTEEDARNAEDFGDLLTDINTIVDGIKNKFVAEMFPSLNQGLNDFIDIWEKDGDKIMGKVKTIADVCGYAFIDIVKLMGDWCNVIDQANLLFSVTGDDVKFVLNEIKKEMNKLVDWWKGVPIVGKIVDFFFTGTPKEEKAASIDNKIQGLSNAIGSIAPAQTTNPIANATTQTYTTNRNVTNTSKVMIDVKGSNANYNVDVDEAFSKDKNVDLNYGYTFAY